MSKTGKPLHFLAWVIGSWIALRVGAFAWPISSPESARPHIALQPVGTVADRAMPGLSPEPSDHGPASEVPPVRARGRISYSPVASRRDGVAAACCASPARLPDGRAPSGANGGIAAVPSAPAVVASPDAQNVPSATVPGTPAQRQRSRWSLSAWTLWRGEARPSLAQAPLLGGAQGGIRLDYRLWDRGSRSLSLYGRVTRALERPFAEEAAMGVAVRPIEKAPVTVMVERRQRLGAGGRSGFAVLAAGGFGPAPLSSRLEAEGYAQAGAVFSSDAAAFADGRMALGYRLTPARGKVDVAVGMAISGGAQPGVSRLDIGPEVRVRLPVAGGHVRLAAEWRQRIAGPARPASGPAITLVADF